MSTPFHTMVRNMRKQAEKDEEHERLQDQYEGVCNRLQRALDEEDRLRARVRELESCESGCVYSDAEVEGLRARVEELEGAIEYAQTSHAHAEEEAAALRLERDALLRICRKVSMQATGGCVTPPEDLPEEVARLRVFGSRRYPPVAEIEAFLEAAKGAEAEDAAPPHPEPSEDLQDTEACKWSTDDRGMPVLTVNGPEPSDESEE